MGVKEEKKPLTIEERIEALKNQGAQAEQQMIQAKEIATKCQGAIEVLQAMLEETTKNEK